MQKMKWPILFAVAGAVAFWLPSRIIHEVVGNQFTGRHVGLLTWLLPCLVMGICGGSYWLKRVYGIPNSPAIWMAIGIWELSGFFITVQSGSRGMAMLMGLIPPYTFIMSTYDGTLGALLIVTVLLIVIGFSSYLIKNMRLKMPEEVESKD